MVVLRRNYGSLFFLFCIHFVIFSPLWSSTVEFQIQVSYARVVSSSFTFSWCVKGNENRKEPRGEGESETLRYIFQLIVFFYASFLVRVVQLFSVGLRRLNGIQKFAKKTKIILSY